jgi:hypothetical protein
MVAETSTTRLGCAGMIDPTFGTFWNVEQTSTINKLQKYVGEHARIESTEHRSINHKKWLHGK